MIDRPPKRFYEFDQFRIDVEERRLLHEDRPVQLTPKVFDILLTLVENNRHTVEKDKLMECVWADAYVEEGSLNRNVSTLRKVLGEDGHDPRFIKTVPKRGYRFESDVHEIVEEDESVIVEKRTKYSVAVREDRELRTRTDAGTKILSKRFWLFAVPVAAVLVLAFAWAAVRAPTSDANLFADGNISSRGTRDTDAFELYQKGRSLWQNRSVVGLHNATQYLEQAIRRDPEFALAHAALADAYAFDVGLWKKAEATANEAIRLDPSLGEPHATIGFIRTFWEWRLREGEYYFKESIVLNPNYATAHQWYALNLIARNQGGSSLAEITRALELEPDSLAINADLCQILYFSRKFDQAIEQCQKTLDLDPNFLAAHQNLYDIYVAKEMYPQAVETFFKSEELNLTAQAHPNHLADLRKAFATGGIKAFWKERIRFLSTQDRPAAAQLARYHTSLGDHEKALSWFERAAGERDFSLIFFATDPLHYVLSYDSRYTNLVQLIVR